MLGRMAEQVFETEMVGLAITCKELGEPLAQEFAALLKHEFKLLDAGGAENVVQWLIGARRRLNFRGRSFERGDALV